MGRISESDLERLKREVSVERLAEARGVKLRRHGKDLIGLCPFHEDREPSLVVTPAKNLWHCLGACQAGGGPIDWVMRAENISFRHAAELLRKDFSSLAAPIAGVPDGRRGPRNDAYKVGKEEKLPRLVEPETPDAIVMKRVVDYYHTTLKESPEALGYLKERGLVHPEVVDHFKLGYANRTLSYRLPPKNRKAGATLRAQLEKLGVMRESGHEHLSGSLVIPILGDEGEVLGMYGRKIRHDLKKNIPRHLYLPGPHRGVFNLGDVKNAAEVILCESLIDALTFWCAGYRHVTSAYGTEGVTKELMAFLKSPVSDRSRHVLIAFDRDDAGDRAAARLAAELGEAGVGVSRVIFPKGMDANEYARKLTPAEKSLGLILRKAELVHAARTAPPVSQEIDPMPVVESTETKPVIEAMETPIDSEPQPLEVEAPIAVESEAISEAELSSLAASLAEPAEPPLRERVPMEDQGDEVTMVLGDRRYRVRGLDKATAASSMRVNLLVSREVRSKDGAGFHVDTLDLYSARHRAQYIKEAAAELGLEERVIKRDLGRVLLELEAREEKKRAEEASPKDKTPAMSASEREAAMTLLKDSALIDRILEDFERAGVVGEETNKLVGYLAATSRKLDSPLAVVLQSSSAAGKSSLMEAILSFIPEEERVQYSAMTGQSLFYMGETDLAHKVLAIAEEQGAKQASYALKLLQSEGELTIASTGKDPVTGKLITHEYRVEGPVMLFLTTTAIEVDEELLNRCLVLSVDEGREQTRAIHELQRRSQTLEGLLERQDRGLVLKLHQDAQRLLRPLLVANPFAKDLRFLDTQTRTRRDHMKYLTLIRSIALLHQYQREVKTVEHRGSPVRYIEVTKEDIALANRLSHAVLGRSLDDLPPQTRRLLELVHAMVDTRCGEQGIAQQDFRFTRREVREWTGWGHTQLKTHLRRLEELEHLIIHRGGARSRFEYELAPLATGLGGLGVLGELGPSDVSSGAESDENLSSDPNWSGVTGNWSGGGRGLVGPLLRPALRSDSESSAKLVGKDRKAHQGSSETNRSNMKMLPVADAQLSPRSSRLPKTAGLSS